MIDIDQKIRTGELNRRIKLLKPAQGEDSLGQPVGGMTVHATVWAKYTPSRYRHFGGAGGEVTALVDVFTIRFRRDIERNMSIDWKGRVYEIDEIKEIGCESGLDLHCRMVQ